VLQALVERDISLSANSTTDVCNMFRISRIQELLKEVPRDAFDRLAREHGANRYSKNFCAWDHLVVMVYAQLSGAQSLREIEAGFNAQRTHHYHLGTHELRRATLADANARRKPEVFADTARTLMSQVGRKVRSSCQDLLYLLDSTQVSLKGRGFDEWAGATRVRSGQGLKLHMLFEAETQAPSWYSITAMNVNDRNEGVRVPIERGATYVFDKGYCDFNWWHEIDKRGAYFVTRFKRNVALRIQEDRAVPPEAAASVLKDQLVRFAHKNPGGGRRNRYEGVLRRVEVAREGKAPLVFATNDLESPASEIARRYKDRWQVELFFKWIKQHLNIKRFCGRSENAVRIQVLTALISYLLLTLYRQAHGVTKSLWDLLAQLRSTLFQRPSAEAAQYHRRRQQLHEFNSRQSGLFA